MQNMQHEEASSRLRELNSVSKIKLSSCRTFHEIDNIPLYKNRFSDIEKFHHPGLAPVSDNTGSYHINLDGTQAYKKRYNKTFGFYCMRAAVIDNGEYYHINIKGDRFYKESYDWLGNYQENKCVARKDDRFFHIDIDGNEIYSEKYDYVGDFKDDIAVVYKQGKASHINGNGKLVHSKWYNKLGIYHKGFAIAEDDNGWFHIDISGAPIYESRYKMVEPFYNGHAKVEGFSGILGQIDVKDNMKYVINRPNSFTLMHQISSELVGFWNTYLLNAAVQMEVLQLLPLSTSSLAKKLKANHDHLNRFLRALWEIKFIKYDKEENIWKLEPKGQFFIDNSFMVKAAKMWGRVIAEENWLKIPELIKQKEIASDLSFKEKENDNNIRTELYQALLGYSNFDMSEFLEKIDISEDSKIILFGVHSLSLIKQLKDNNINSIGFYNEPHLPNELTDGFDINLIEKNYSLEKYNLAILGRFLQHQDDQSVLKQLNLLKRNNILRIILIETLIEEYSPQGSVVDINIMVETGGKLRSMPEWQRLIQKIGDFRINKIIPLTSYLSIVDIRRMEL